MTKTGGTALQVGLIALFALGSAALYGLVFTGLAGALSGSTLEVGHALPVNQF